MQSCLASLRATRKIALAFRMHDCCVRMVQTYGSAVWTTGSYCSDPVTVIRGVLEASHFQFMRRWCRLRANVCIHAELGRLPFHYFRWRENFRFWNLIVVWLEGSIWRDIMLDNLADQDSRRRYWSGQVKAFMSGIGYLFRAPPIGED